MSRLDLARGASVWSDERGGFYYRDQDPRRVRADVLSVALANLPLEVTWPGATLSAETAVYGDLVRVEGSVEVWLDREGGFYFRDRPGHVRPDVLQAGLWLLERAAGGDQ